jgi:hypothetical protein
MRCVSLRINRTLFSLLLTLSPLAHASDAQLAFIAAEAGDYTTAVAQWNSLAQNGNPEAQFNLGLMYHSGLGGSINEPEAVRWYERAAQNGYPKAQEFLAIAYREGWFGLTRDASKADYWLNQLELNP